MADKQIICILKPLLGTGPEHITEVGFADGTRLPVVYVIQTIKDGTHSYYVLGGGQRAVVTVQPMEGREYIRTRPDSTGKDNLLSLPTCR